MINSTVDALNRLAGNGTGTGAVAAQAARRRHGRARQGRSGDAAARRDGVRAAAEDGARRFARSVPGARTITRDNLPPDLAQEWVTPDGQARIDVAPKGDPNNNEVLAQLRPRRSVRRAGRDRGTDLDPRGAPHGRHRLHRGRRLRAAFDRDHSVDHAAADQRRAADADPAAAGRRRHAGNLRA